MSEHLPQTPQDTNYGSISLIRDALLFLSQLGIFVAVSGFVVVQRALAEFTDLFTYNIVPTQYLAAGASLLIYVPTAFVLRLWAEFDKIIWSAGVAIFVSICSIFILVWRNRNREPSLRVRFRIAIGQALNFIEKLSPFQRGLRIIYTVYLILFAIGTGLWYGEYEYINTPRWAGGGQPASVILLFGTNVPSNIPFQVTNGRSPVLKLLAQLTDGIFVWDENTKLTSQIRNDVLIGIVGAEPSAVPFIPISTPTIISTPVATIPGP